MKIAVICLVLFGLLAAIGAAVLVAALTLPKGSAKLASAPAEQMIDVLTAGHDLDPMSAVDTASVVTKKTPKSQVPENALLNPVQVVGRVLTMRMVAGQPFTKACFAREGAGVYLASAVPPGKRAMSISLTDWSGMAGLLYPGSVVDVLVSFKTLGINGRQNETEMMSTTLLQGLQVLAIGSQSIAVDDYKDKSNGALSQRGDMNTRMITLMVDPKQAEILQLASQSGSISLAMRNPLDKGQEARRLTRAREIKPGSEVASVPSSEDIDPFEVPSKPAAESHNPNEWETTIIRGKESQKRTFPLPDEQTATQRDRAAATQPAAAAEAESKHVGIGI